jgi:RNA polymerase sigma factor (sigma-70 family)
MHQSQSAASDPAADLPGVEENRALSRLIGRAREGDTSAFEELYGRTARWLLSHVRRLVDDGQAEDVLAEVYLQVWKTLGSYDETRGPPRVWLAMIARTRALDHLRREKRRGEVHCSPQVVGSPELERPEGPEQLLARAEQCRAVQLSLRCPALSGDERTVLALAYFGDNTQQEIAGITGWPLGTVKTLMSRAQHKLRADFSAGAALAAPMQQNAPSP